MNEPPPLYAVPQVQGPGVAGLLIELALLLEAALLLLLAIIGDALEDAVLDPPGPDDAPLDPPGPTPMLVLLLGAVPVDMLVPVPVLVPVAVPVETPVAVEVRPDELPGPALVTLLDALELVVSPPSPSENV